MNYKKLLINKIKKNNSKICVVGLGYVGLPLAIQFSKKFKVFGFDIDKEKLKSFRNNKSYIKQFSHAQIKKLNSKGFFATNDPKKISEADVIVFCLPTPLKNSKPDLSYVNNCIKLFFPYIKKGSAICFESTSYPGTTDFYFVKKLEKKFNIGKELFIIYSPEREDPGNKNFQINKITKIVSGYTNNCKNIGKLIYLKIVSGVYLAPNIKIAEMAKLLENIYRAINISLVNELKILSKKLGIDIFEVIKAARTKPFGFQAFYPGPGIGGHCIPVDPFYLSWLAKKNKLKTDLINLAGKINKQMPNYIVKSVLEYFKNKKRLNIIILGISYKKNIDDCRNSPSLEIIKLLKKKGHYIVFADPYVDKFPKSRDHKYECKKILLNKYNLSKADCVILATDHNKFKYKLIYNYSKIIFDCRNVFKNGSTKVLKI
jgi:UDP-N-acetyl-D-glucosamine dehydrogenase